MSDQPLVSVVIPVRDGGDFLPQCLDSVLQQNYEPLEVVVADHASTDDSLKIVHSYADSRIKILPSAPRDVSLQENWSRAVAAAEGEYVKIVGQDDLLQPGSLTAQAHMLELHQEAALVSGRRRIIDDRGHVLIRSWGLGSLTGTNAASVRSRSEVVRACVRAGTNLLGEPVCVMIRRAAIANSSFDPRWQYAIDLAFYLRCLEHGVAILSPGVIASFRVGPRQLSAALANRQNSELKSFFEGLRNEELTPVTAGDLRLGMVRCRLKTLGRRTLYTLMRVRESTSSWSRDRAEAHHG